MNTSSNNNYHWIDTHCHLDADYGTRFAADLIRDAQNAGVAYLVTIGVDFDSIKKIEAISEQYPNVCHTVGIHPHEANSLENFADGLEVIRKAAAHPKCRAMGEIGLDYYYQHSPRDIQIRAFERQADLALELGLPIVVHTRDAEEDQLKLLEKFVAHRKLPPPHGIIHCFTGTHAFGLKCIEMGFLISFSGIITFKNAEDLRKCAKDFPLDSLLVETDSPFLAPVPFRGKKCEPSMVKLTGQKIAELKGIPVEDVAQVTSQNAAHFFKL